MRRVDLLGRVRREADDPFSSDDPPCLLDGSVLLTYVDAVCVRMYGEVGTVVEDEQRSVLRTELAGVLRGREDVLVGRVLHPQLHDFDAAT